MADLKNPKLIWFKGWLFLLGGLLASVAILIEAFTWKVALLLAIAVWCFCRFYYFAFYVIEHYVDPSYKFAGLWDFFKYVLGRRPPSDGGAYHGIFLAVFVLTSLTLFENILMKRFAFFAAVLTTLVGVTAHAQEADADDPFRVPVLDIDAQDAMHTVVDREPGQYLGHPTTVLLDDGKTILCVYPKGHGKGGIVYKRSDDGGRTWSDRLPTPKSWETSKEVPTIHRVVDAQGNKRLIVWSGLYPVRLSVSEDDGKTWSELNPVGDWGGIVVMGCVVALDKPGRYMAMFHDDGRFFTPTGKRANPVVFTLYKTFSDDGGLTWSTPEAVWTGSDVHLCEPGAVRSPDGKQIAVLLRENKRVRNSHIIFTDDEGKTFTKPVELPNELTGDRHTAVYASNGRLFISFRDRSPKGWTSPTEGDWVGWVGAYRDLIDGGKGDFRIRIKDNTQQWDCAYPGVVVLPDQTIVTTTYGHWDKGQPPYIRSARFKLNALDALLAKP